MRRFEDAMFEQAQLIRFVQSSVGKRYLASYEASMREPEYGTDAFHTLPPGIVEKMLTASLLRGDPIFVHLDVCETVDFALKTWDLEIALPNDPFTMAGFAYLAKPICTKDVRGVDMRIRAITWLPIWGSIFDDGHIEDGTIAPRDDLPAGVWLNYLVGDDDEVGKRIKAVAPLARLTPIQTFWMPFNRRSWETIDDEAYLDVCKKQWSLVQVLWRLGQQFVRTQERAPRAARRDLQRVRRPIEDVTVITLRKSRDGYVFPEEGRGADYRYRFVVRGHWRNQWYPSLGEHRQKWINPYIKGPDDKPLHLTERVFDFVR